MNLNLIRTGRPGDRLTVTMESAARPRARRMYVFTWTERNVANGAFAYYLRATWTHLGAGRFGLWRLEDLRLVED